MTSKRHRARNQGHAAPTSGTGETSRTDVEALFVDFVQRIGAGEAVSIDALCRQYPETASQLRKLHTDWLEMCQVVERITSSSSSSRTLRDSLGEAVGADRVQTPDAEEAARIERLLSRLGGSGSEPGRYALCGSLGQGGMGVVVRVWDRDMCRTLAMKLILARGESSVSAETPPMDENRVRRFLREARITGQLDHPGIVPVHEIGVSESGRLFFTMREVRGETLSRIIERSRAGDEEWGEQRVLDILLRACEALAYAHSRGVIHRDLKPENIMVGPFGQAYVMDWGLAMLAGRAESQEPPLPAPGEGGSGENGSGRSDPSSASTEEPRLTGEGYILGTPPSMSPEQARGEAAAVDERTDIYAMGAVLYQILTGQPPYHPPGERVHKLVLLERVRQGPPEKIVSLRPDAPAELVAICEKAMARDPGDRYADMVAMAADLRAFLEGRVVKAYRVGPIIELRKWIGRNRATAAALLVALVTALGGLGLTNYVSYAKQKEITERNKALDRSARDILGLADQRRAEELLAQSSDDLWPRRPEKVEVMQRWLDGARELVGRIEPHQQFLEKVAAVTDDGPLADLIGRSLEKNWLRSQLTDLLANLERLRDEVIPYVEQRLAVASSIEEKTVDDHADAWAEAIEAIIDDPRFDGLEIEPQVGLVPIGPDPDSGLQEFWVWETGGEPLRDEETDRIHVTEEMGMVLVLLPGGEFLMGAQHEDKAKPHYDPQAKDPEGPVHLVSVDPFFISKYEMTQAQWRRVTGVNPSYLQSPPLGGPTCPVENVNWTMCRETCRRLGLDLPTEARWEYACRAGTDTIWWTGDDKASLEGAANLFDTTTYQRNPETRWWGIPEPWGDPFSAHGPVGSLRANPWGLHDMTGNVQEWCFDRYRGSDDEGNRSRDPEVREEREVGPESVSRICRGGSCMYTSIEMRSAARNTCATAGRDDDLGLRPVAPLRFP